MYGFCHQTSWVRPSFFHTRTNTTAKILNLYMCICVWMYMCTRIYLCGCIIMCLQCKTVMCLGLHVHFIVGMKRVYVIKRCSTKTCRTKWKKNSYMNSKSIHSHIEIVIFMKVLCVIKRSNGWITKVSSSKENNYFYFFALIKNVYILQFTMFLLMLKNDC